MWRLLAAFPVPGEMKIVVDRADLGVSFANFLAADGIAYDAALFNLLQWVDAQDKDSPTNELGRAEEPGESQAQGCECRKLADLESRFSELRPVGTFGEAERIVLKGVEIRGCWPPWIDRVLRRCERLSAASSRMPELATTMAGYGTGFLVAPDVVMTNYHVARSFWVGTDRAERVRLRFDYESARAR